LVLLDIRLGEESGLDVLRKIRETDKNIKVIMVTAMDDEGDIRRAKELGADDYVVKPITAGCLHDLVLQKISMLSAGKNK
jgi:DNA-binding response OmpR family regulator